MNQPGKLSSRQTSVRKPVVLGLFVGTAVGAGYLMAGVPNVELMSLIIALSGAVLGPVLGPVCGALAGAIFSLGNPYGPPPPVLLVAQVMGHALTGFVGWFFGKKILQGFAEKGSVWSLALAAVAGFSCTLAYQIFTNLAIVVMTPDMDPKVVVAGMAYFALVHIGVNTILFFLFFPHLVRRLAQVGQSPLIGRNNSLLLIVLCLLGFGLSDGALAQPAAVDSTASAPKIIQPAVAPDSLALSLMDESPVEGPLGWKRPLWVPFSSSTLQWLNTRTSWIPVIDGGLGGMAMILGEANTSYSPLFMKNGVPQGTGHRLADDPWLLSHQASVVDPQHSGFARVGGADGVINIVSHDQDHGKAVSIYRGVKGPHETYMRGISLLTPKTAWRLGFEFDENIDDEGYNYTELPDENFSPGEEFRGHASIRRSRTFLTRHLDDDNSLTLEYHTARKTKDDLPSMEAEHQEIWADGATVRASSRRGGWTIGSALYWESRTVLWGDRNIGAASSESLRKLESGREGLILDLVHSSIDTTNLILTSTSSTESAPGSLNGAGHGFHLMVQHWNVHDDGVDWDELPTSNSSGEGTEARLAANTGMSWGFSQLNVGLYGDHHDLAGMNPGGFVAFQQSSVKPWWKLVVEAGGRAPRSDELLTPMMHVVSSRELYLRPNVDLKHEKTLRANVLLDFSVLGFDFAMDASAKQLRDGITWIADSGETTMGQWRNDLEMDSQRLTASIARQGRFLGWGRARLEGTWQEFDEKMAKAAFLPPKQYLRMELMWEQHLFKEDGIVQMALLGTFRGPMGDPWDVTRDVIMPSSNSLDLLLGFRLRGAHLSLNFRNVTDQRVRLSSATLSPGREIDMRLHWTFLH